VFVTVFADESRAALADRGLATLEGEGLIVLLAAAVISRDLGGEARFSVRGLAGRHLSTRADIIATMLGVVLPSRVIATGLMAATVDGAGGEAAEREFNETFMRELSATIEPGSSLFIAVIDDLWVAEIERGLRGYHRLTQGYT
jgi:uncharacterized membrane protein